MERDCHQRSVFAELHHIRPPLTSGLRFAYISLDLGGHVVPLEPVDPVIPVKVAAQVVVDIFIAGTPVATLVKTSPTFVVPFVSGLQGDRVNK